ncbi:MAG: biotin/lipoyl-binding protein [Bryobacteraceae bacterium]
MVIWILLLLLLALAFVLILHHHEEAKKKAAALAVKPAPGITVTSATAQKGSIGVYLDAIGTVTPVNTASITSEVTGLIVTVHYQEGQLVQKGDPLVDIDPRLYRAMLLQAQGALERDENVLAQAQMDLERYRAAAVPEHRARADSDGTAGGVHRPRCFV